MKVSVIVPVYNEEKSIAACLDHIFDQEVMPDEVIIVDNNCIDSTIKIVKKYPVIVVHEEVQGMTPARNRGFDSASGQIIARTDADTWVPRDWVKNIKKSFRDKEVVALTGPVHFHDVSERTDVAKIPMYAYSLTFRRMFHHYPLFGPNMAIRKSAWSKVKNKVCLDDKIVHEDIDLALHISQYGKIVFSDELDVMSSARRWKRLEPYFEYPLRYLRTIKKHHELLIAYKQSSRLAKRIIFKLKTKDTSAV
jgi:glycosyltransferase involved in cell wall biosynthesis